MQTQEVINYIVNWLTSYAQKAKMKGFVVGISGGIDSAVTSTLCAKTGLEVLCVEMPIHQQENQRERAQNHIAWLQNKFPLVREQQVDLSPVFDMMITQLPSIAKESNRFLTLANTRARLRMTALYYFAGLHRLLVAGTGNKVEDFGIGFFTKYGDGGVDISPIADLLKSEVYTIAKRMEIDKEIIAAAPTDGLWGDDRTDEDQIGASYLELEWAMQQFEQNKKAENFKGRQRIVFKIFEKWNTANQHKMLPIPVCSIPKKFD